MRAWIISSAILIIAVALLRTALGKKLSPSVRYALWLLVLARLLIPGGLFESPISVMNAVPERLYSAPESGIYAAEPTAAPESAELTGTEPIAAQPAKSEPPRDAYPWYMTLWVAGGALTALVLAASNLSFYTRLRRSRKRMDIHCALPVYVTDVPASPCLFGLFRPAVYLTKAAAESGKLRYILAHELAHKRHGDNWWSLFRCACLVLWWWEPLVWLAAALSREDGELACDEAAIRSLGEESRFEYGGALIDMIAVRRAPSGLLSLSTAMVSGKRGFRERLEAIIKKPRTYLSAIVAAALIMAVAAGCTFTSAKPSASPEPMDFSGTYGGPLNGVLAGEVIELFDPYGKDGLPIMTIPASLWDGLPGGEAREGEAVPGSFYAGAFQSGFCWAVCCSEPAMGGMAINVSLSENGGETWERVTPPTEGTVVSGAGFRSGEAGYICYRYTGDAGPVIYETRDGGKSWSRMDISRPLALNGYHMTARCPDFDGAGTEFPVDVYNGDGSLAGTAYYKSADGVSWSWSALEAVAMERVSTPDTVSDMSGYTAGELLEFYLGGDRADSEGALAELWRLLHEDTFATLSAISRLDTSDATGVLLNLTEYLGAEHLVSETVAVLNGVIAENPGGEEARLAQGLKKDIESQNQYDIGLYLSMDLDHDGVKNERLVVDVSSGAGEGRYSVSILDESRLTVPVAPEKADDPSVLWRYDAYLAYPGWAQLYLTRYPDAKYRVLVYTPTLYEGVGAYSYKLIDLEGGTERVYAENSVTFRIDGTEPIDAHALAAFSEEVNAIIAKGELLVSTGGGKYVGPGANIETMYETYPWLYDAGLTYGADETLERRIQRYSDYVTGR